MTDETTAANGETPDKPFTTPPMWLIPWISKAHVAAYKLTSGKIGADLAGKPGILLRTIGRKSGKVHTVCLPYIPDGDAMVVVASFAGADHHPAWFHNIKSAGEVLVRDRDKVFWATAEVVKGETRPALWQKVVEDSPWYAEYQEKTTRQIPMLRLTYDRPYAG